MDVFLQIPGPNSMALLKPVLPIEVFEKVIDQARNNAASLQHLSLSCKAFQPRARYHLFNGIRIETVQQLESSGEFLDSNPWLIPIVRRVAIGVLISWHDNDDSNNNDDDDDDDDDGVQYRLFDVVPVHLLSRLPNLRSWSIKPNTSAELSLHRLTISCYHKYGVGIQNLELFHVVLRHSILDFARLVSMFPNLQTLTCFSIDFWLTEGSDPNPSLYNLEINMPQMAQTMQSLEIRGKVDMLVVKYLFAASASTVISLVLTIQPHFEDQTYWFAVLINKLSRLSSLKLVIESHEWFDDHERLLESIHGTTQILQHIDIPLLSDLQVEFHLDAVADFGRWILEDGPPLESCRALEDVLLAFKTPGRILFRRPLADHRVTRSQFWSAAIERAFPRLRKTRLLTLMWSANISSHPVGHEWEVTSLITSNDGKWIATASRDGTVIAWDAERSTIAQERVAHHGHEVNDLAFRVSPDSRRLVSAGSGKADILIVWDVCTGFRKFAALEGHSNDVLTCTWSPDGSLIASGSIDGTVRVWDARTFQQQNIFEDPATVYYPTDLEFSRDGSYLAWRSELSGFCAIWKPFTEKHWLKILTLTHSGRFIHMKAFSFDPYGRRIATAHGDPPYKELMLKDYVVQIWDVASGAVLAVLAGHSESVTNVSFSQDGRSLLSIAQDGTTRIWDTDSWEETASLRVEEGKNSKCALWRACFSPDGKYVATGSLNGMVRLWRTGNASSAIVFTEDTTGILHVSFTPDGKFLASGHRYGIVSIRRLSDVIED